MNSIVPLLISISVALFLGFAISFVGSPDPTGILPVAVGVVLTGLLSPILYFGFQRLVITNESST